MSQLKRTLWHVLMGSTVGLLAISSFAAGDRPAQEAKWENLKELSQGQEIKVVLNDGKAYRGRLADVSDEEIKVSLATGNATFARQDILRVSYKTGSHHLRNAALGAAIGSAAGLGAASAARCGSQEGPGLCYGGTVAFVAGLGAGVGAFLPSQAWRDVYRAR